MINLSPTEAIWLIPDEQIGRVFDSAAAKVRKAYRGKYHTPARGNQLGRLIKGIEGLGPSPFKSWNKTEIEDLLACCFYGSQNTKKIPAFAGFTTSSMAATPTFIKLAFIELWNQRKIILPQKFTLPISIDDITDTITLEGGCDSLILVRSINPISSIKYDGSMNIKERGLRAVCWYRMILASTIYTPNDLTEQDISVILANSVGKKSKLLRYYANDFLATLSEKSSSRQKLNAYLELEATKKRDKEASAKPGWKAAAKSKVSDTCAELSLRYLTAKTPTTDVLSDIYSNAILLRKGFSIRDFKNLPGGYTQAPEKVIAFCMLLDTTYRAFIRSKRLQREKDAMVSLNFILCYCALYLYRFHIDRDGHLENYPATLNDFSCAVHITADELLLEGIATFNAKQPQTLLRFVRAISEKCLWGNNTLYNRILCIDRFIQFIVDNSHVLPDADQVRNSFSPACYPRLQRSYGTVKKPVPRAYFATFLNMLYSLEYLIMHLNDMASGSIPGVISDCLVHPTINELNHHPNWAGLWGNRSLGCDSVNLAALNYCPIFYHDKKIKKFEYIPRFYRLSDMEIGGKIERRIITNDIRLTMLMCETGIRQQHLIWLNKEKYDHYLDFSSRRMLAPLLVSSDKAHGEWSAIVSRHVIDLLDRQREWYDKCSSPDYREDLWYGMKVESKFDRFKPLFRLPIHQNLWANYTSFPLLLLTLQYFIRNDLGDQHLPDLVWTQPKRTKKEFISSYRLDNLAQIGSKTLKSNITPHGLRAGFVSEAIKFLPPSLVGLHLTGQSEELVYYYSLLDDDPAISHEQLLCNALLNSASKIEGGDAPALADAILLLNQRLSHAIQKDPEEAIANHRLMSLMAVKDGKNGIDIIRAKESTSFAYNSTHICPFNNLCPKEVLAMFSMPNVCSLCPYAIRGVGHLPAISAEKDKYKELMVGALQMISTLSERKPEKRNHVDLEQLEQQHDHFARQAVALEAIEMQLVEMANTGNETKLFLRNRDELMGHYTKLAINDEAKMLKRLIDVQSFPDLSSPDLDCRLAHLRAVLMMHDGSIRDHLGIAPKRPGTLGIQVAAQINSMVRTGAIEMFDIYKICATEEKQNQLLEQPIRVISQYII
ncbi:hypothetical protein D3C77_96710 [compost metagenome]